MRPITGILLAAGAGRRFGVLSGTHKLLQTLPGGEPLAVAAGRNLIAAVPDSIAVVRAGDLQLAAALAAVGLRIVEHPGAEGGLGTSLAAGVAAAPDAAGWLIALGDMPWVQPDTISDLAQALAGGAPLVAPTTAGHRGHPVGFAALWRDHLLNLRGDQGARDLIAAQAGQLLLLPTEDPGVLLDVDTPADLPSLHRSAV